jgi:hypothetical protein
MLQTDMYHEPVITDRGLAFLGQDLTAFQVPAAGFINNGDNSPPGLCLHGLLLQLAAATRHLA